MTAGQIIACAVAWTASIVAITAVTWMAGRVRREPVRWEVEDGMVTFDRKLTEAEVEAFKAEWLRRYGSGTQRCVCKTGSVCVWHGVQKAIKDEDGVACSAYQPPTDPADSGLCARCGMYDYKHQEAAHDPRTPPPR